MEKGLPVTGAAARLGVTERTMFAWIADGRVRTIEATVTTPRLVPLSEIERLRTAPKPKRKHKSNPTLVAAPVSDNKTAAAGGD